MPREYLDSRNVAAARGSISSPGLMPRSATPPCRVLRRQLPLRWGCSDRDWDVGPLDAPARSAGSAPDTARSALNRCQPSVSFFGRLFNFLTSEQGEGLRWHSARSLS